VSIKINNFTSSYFSVLFPFLINVWYNIQYILTDDEMRGELYGYPSGME